MQYEFIAKPGFHKNLTIFRRDTSIENCWHSVGIVDVFGTLRFSNLTTMDEQRDINLFVVYNDLSNKQKTKSIFLPQVG